MPNMTITADEEVLRWARIRAAELGTSVSRLVGEMLREKMQSEARYRAAWESWNSIAPRDISGGEAYPSRDETHER